MDLYAITALLADSGTGYLTLALLVSAFFFKRLDGLRKALVFYLILMIFIDLLSIFVGRKFGANHIMFPIYSFLELSFFFYLFKKYLLKQKHIAVTVLWVVGLVYIVFEFFYKIIYQQQSALEYQPYAKTVDNFVIIIFTLTYLLEKMTTYNESRWDNFSLNMGLLINFTLSTIFFLPFNFLVNEKVGLKYYFWICNVFLIYAFYTYLIVDIIMNARKNGSLKKQV